MKSKGKLQVAVVGSSEENSQWIALAAEVGKTIAHVGAVLVCGGLAGTMQAAARGAKKRGGLTVGIVPSYEKASANPYIDVIIPSGLGHARNVLVVASGDMVVALPGSHGTRSEISIALKLGKPVFGVKAWGEIAGVEQLNNIADLHRKLCLFFRQTVST